MAEGFGPGLEEPPSVSTTAKPVLADSSRGSAAARRWCGRSKKARLGGSVRKFLTLRRSGKVSSLKPGLDLGLRPETIVELPSGRNNSKAVGRRSQADSTRSTGSNPSIPLDQAVRRPKPNPACDSLLFVSLNLGVAGLGLVPKRLPARHACADAR